MYGVTVKNNCETLVEKFRDEPEWKILLKHIFKFMDLKSTKITCGCLKDINPVQEQTP
jgi:hypothetical protein